MSYTLSSLESQKRWREKNREKVRGYKKNYMNSEKGQERYRAYRRKYNRLPDVKSRRIENARRWREENKERIKEYNKQRYLKTKSHSKTLFPLNK